MNIWAYFKKNYVIAYSERDLAITECQSIGRTHKTLATNLSVESQICNSDFLHLYKRIYVGLITAREYCIFLV